MSQARVRSFKHANTWVLSTEHLAHGLAAQSFALYHMGNPHQTARRTILISINNGSPVLRPKRPILPVPQAKSVTKHFKLSRVDE